MRYFIVFYRWQIALGVNGVFYHKSEKYPSHKELKAIVPDRSYNDRRYEITNIIELNNETDFNDFIK